MIKLRGNSRGFTMIELVMVIIVIGIITAVATVKMLPSIEGSKYEATKSEMQALAFAIAGNPDVIDPILRHIPG